MILRASIWTVYEVLASHCGPVVDKLLAPKFIRWMRVLSWNTISLIITWVHQLKGLVHAGFFWNLGCPLSLEAVWLRIRTAVLFASNSVWLERALWFVLICPCVWLVRNLIVVIDLLLWAWLVHLIWIVGASSHPGWRRDLLVRRQDYIFAFDHISCLSFDARFTDCLLDVIMLFLARITLIESRIIIHVTYTRASLVHTHFTLGALLEALWFLCQCMLDLSLFLFIRSFTRTNNWLAVPDTRAASFLPLSLLLGIRLEVVCTIVALVGKGKIFVLSCSIVVIFLNSACCDNFNGSSLSSSNDTFIVLFSVLRSLLCRE